eukprot:jgi/Tetstr1/421072/TSEL_012117.t1
MFPGLETLDLFHVAMDRSCRSPVQVLAGPRRRGPARFGIRRIEAPSETAAAACVAALLEGLHKLPRLTRLSLDGAYALRDSQLGALSALTTLTKLSFNNDHALSGEGLTALAPLSRLAELSMHSCHGLMPHSLQALRPLASSLTSLSLDRAG